MGQPVLKRIAEGDERAVRLCVEEYGSRVWALARRFTRTRADAEDAVQEVFMAIWRSAGRFDPQQGEEATFVTMIARRRLIDRLRKEQKSTEFHAERPELEPGPPPSSSKTEDSAEVQAISQLLGAFESPQRDIIVMSVYGGFSHAAIADRLKLPLGTVKTHLRRGLNRVREMLNIDEEVSP